ncbi:MAG TPA: ribosome-associated translation inhibitor RaiA [Candidatus Saccharimonadales bacterium]|nr:ribosome-associated translation inhibitor RaiA [Candidatus Saccharimonadales bacterium]
MIKQIAIVGDGVELKDDVKKYITKKIGKLDRYIPRHARKSVHAEVKMRETTHKSVQNNNKYECEVLIHLPGEQATAKEATLNMFAAVDIVESKLKNQLHRYKEQAIKDRRVSRERLRTALRRLAPVGSEETNIE